MDRFTKTLIASVALASTSAIAYIYGTTEATAQAESRLTNACNVQVGGGQYWPGFQCPSNTVQVGIQGSNLICAQLYVDCPTE